jgi:hypothetical protein
MFYAITHRIPAAILLQVGKKKRIVFTLLLPAVLGRLTPSDEKNGREIAWCDFILY